MSTHRVFKYNANEHGEYTVPYGNPSVVLVDDKADEHGQFPTIWCSVDVYRDGGLTEYVVLGTGQPFDPDEHRLVGSAVCGAFVWHVAQLIGSRRVDDQESRHE